jgi:hypothetical protein
MRPVPEPIYADRDSAGGIVYAASQIPKRRHFYFVMKKFIQLYDKKFAGPFAMLPCRLAYDADSVDFLDA